jgi:hypothetical protein
MNDIAAISTTTAYRPAKAAKPFRFALVPFDQIEISAGASYLVKGLIPRAGLVVV